MSQATDIHLKYLLESNMESKHNVKDRLFQKKCRAGSWDSVNMLFLTLQVKPFPDPAFVWNALLILRNCGLNLIHIFSGWFICNYSSIMWKFVPKTCGFYVKIIFLKCFFIFLDTNSLQKELCLDQI